MPMHVETQALISALQSLVLALMLWAGTQSAAGRLRSSMHLRSAALALEGLGWGALAVQAWLTPLQLILGGNALNLLAQGLEVVALCMLLGVGLRWRRVLAIGVLGWLGEAWLTMGAPDYRLRVLWGSLALLGFVLLRMAVLLGSGARRGSRARSVLLVVNVTEGLLVVWRNLRLWLDMAPPRSILQPEAINYVYVLLSGMQPLFASIGFLLLYNEILQRELHELARVDALTGVHNRLALSETAARMLAQSGRTGRPLGVLMLDADRFKSVNDRFGHGGGDKALLSLVSTIGATLRGGTVLGRVGGEEFVVLAPDTGLDALLALGERIRRTVESTPITVEGQLLRLTVSIGAAASVPGEREVPGLLQRADAALYAAKHAGRNRVTAAAVGPAGKIVATDPTPP